MTQESQSYNLGTLRELLIQAFTTDELRELVTYDDRLKGLVHEFAPTDSIAVMADKAIAWCDRRGVIGYLVARVKDERPNKVKSFEPSLLRADAPPPSRDAAAEAAGQAARLERERREREAAERRRAEQAHAEQVAGLMAQGLGHLQEDKWWLAIQSFRQVLALAPDHAEALSRIAEAERQEQIANRLVAGQGDLKAGRWSEAISHFRAVLEIEPVHQEATTLLATAQAQDCAQREAEARQAERACEEAEELAQVPAGGGVATAWLIFGVVLLFSIVAPLNHSGVLAIVPILRNELGWSGSSAGLLLSVYAITGLLLALPAGLIYQKAGARMTGLLAGGLILLGATLGAVSQNTAVFVAGCVVEGVGAAFMAVLAPAIIVRWFAARQRGTALGIWVAWMTIGSAAMLLAAPALVEAASWRWVRWLGAGYALVVTVLYVALVKPAPASGSAARSEAASAPSVTPALVLRSRNIWLLAAAFAGFIAATSSLGSHMPLFLQAEHGLALAQVGPLSWVATLIAIFSAPAGGALSDRIGSRKKPYLVGLAAMVVLLPLVGVLGVGWLIVPVVVYGLVQGAVPPTFFAAAAESAGDERLDGVAMAAIVVGRNAGLLLGPLVFLAVASASDWPAAFASLAVMSALGLLAGWRARVR